MKKTNCLLTLSVAALCAAGRAYAVGTAPAILSNYGEIQSVKNYSSNPFWNKNSPYNQNFPKPIYATGADLNTGDCNRVVENLVAAYCVEHNYCRNLRISDVRPTIMVQLSQLPGHNFATSCGGYIDSTFDKFQKEYGNTSAVNLPNTATQNTNIQITNPFAPKQTAEQRAVADRTAELERLQSITTPAAGVHAEYFPKTTADLSFTDRLANTAAGYEPYKDKESYKKPNFLGEDEAFFERLKNQNFEEYCNRRPENPECVKWYCEQHPDDEKCKKGSVTTPPTDPNPVVNPPATGCPEIADHRDPKTCKCYPSDFMDSTDCKCRGRISTWDATNHKCVCPISTANLATEEWAYVTTMCQCPSTKPNYNATTHLCEKDNNDKKYMFVQCVLKSYQSPFEIGNNVSKLTITDQCKSTYGNTYDECFTRCMNGYNTADQQTKGYINTLAGISIPWCAYSRHSDTETSGGTLATKPVPFFSAAISHPTESDPSFNFNNSDKKPSHVIQPLVFSENDKDAITNNIKSGLPNNRCKVDRYHTYWHIYVLEITPTPDLYKVVDKIEIDR